MEADKNDDSRAASTRVQELVDYDEKRHMKDIDQDIKHGVVHQEVDELEERLNDLSESWETESLFEDAFEDLAEDKYFSDG
jgi:NAD-dependent histone deacetylase SIR2